MKKILHITNWYPNKWNNLEALFIKEQFNLFSKVTESYLVNVQVREGKSFLRYEYIKYSNNEEGYYLLTKIKSNKIIECLTTCLLLWVLFKKKYKKYDLLHFHIAYPLLTYYYIWKKIIKIPILISEHWSAYHFNFYMAKETRKLDTIKRIFQQHIPLISVSKALLKDIQIFSKNNNFKNMVIPNVVNNHFFYYKPYKKNKIPTFFILNNWRKIKNPFPLLEGFHLLHQKEINFKLIIGGYGEELISMRKFISKSNFLDKVIFLGKMDKRAIADTLWKSDAFLFSSEYETFSVVCAEALSCGVPLLGPKISAIEEYTTKESFLALTDNNSLEWSDKLIFFIKTSDKYNRKKISKYIYNYLNIIHIKKLYLKALDEWF